MDKVENLALPPDKKHHQKIFSKWAKRASKKNKACLIPVMLLPHAACSPNDDDEVDSVNIAEAATLPGTWVVNLNSAGAIAITPAGGN